MHSDANFQELECCQCCKHKVLNDDEVDTRKNLHGQNKEHTGKENKH